MYCKSDPEIEKPLLLDLWRWKLFSTAAIHSKFFQNLKRNSAYRRLHILEQRKLITTIAIEKRINEVAWAITQKGFREIENELPDLREAGFQSEATKHDFLVTAFHLGEWLKSSPPGVELFSEQELRRFKEADYPSWVPKNASHRPDGYSRVIANGKPNILAFEVELTRKRNHDYASTGCFYDLRKEIRRVLWLVETKAQAFKLFGKLEATARSRKSPHVFVCLTDFKRLGWNALILCGRDAGENLFYLLENDLLQNAGRPNQNPCVEIAGMLDCRKQGTVTSPSAIAQNAHERDRLGIHLSRSVVNPINLQLSLSISNPPSIPNSEGGQSNE